MLNYDEFIKFLLDKLVENDPHIFLKKWSEIKGRGDVTKDLDKVEAVNM